MFLLCSFLGIACLYDYGKRRIPNLLIGLMLIGGVGQGVYQQGWRGGGLFLCKAICVVAVLYPLFKIGAFGAGDVKLYGACAGYFPSTKIFWFLFISLLVAAIFSLIKLIKERNVWERLGYFCEYILTVVQNGRWHLYMENERDTHKAGICLAGPILCSALLYLGGAY